MTLLELEKLRKKSKRILIINIACGLLGVFLHFTILGILLMVMSIIFFLTVGKNQIENYKKLFKNNIVKASLEGIFTELYYETNQGISFDEVKDSGLIVLKDEFASNDLIVAKYGKVKFKQSDIIITEIVNEVEQDGMSRQSHKAGFRGRFLIFDFLKPTETLVKVIGKNFNSEGYKQGVIKITKSKITSLKNENQVFMESDKFNSNFNAFSNDAQMAFYILTPQIVEAITTLSNQYEGKIAISFINEKMFVAISSKQDSLEPKLLSKRTIWEEKEYVLNDINVITNFIELMSLEKNTLVATSN